MKEWMVAVVAEEWAALVVETSCAVTSERDQA